MISITLLTKAQTEDVTIARETIVLKNGSRLTGRVIELVPGDYVVFETTNGARVKVLESHYKRIISSPNHRQKEVSFSVEKGFYHASTAGTIMNTVGKLNGGTTGFELTAVVGYQFKRMIGGGIGIGADWYFPDGGEMIFPLFAEYRGYILDRRVSPNVNPYINLRSGYGFAFANEDIGIISADGGFMFNPAIGWRFGGIRDTHFTVDVGMKFQKASFEYRRNSDRSDVDLTYRRLNLRVGVLF